MHRPAVIVILAVVGLLAVYWYSQPPALPDFDALRIYTEDSATLKRNMKPGQVWPSTNPCAGTNLPYFLITPSCTSGKNPALVNNGGGKCTNKGNNVWSGCVSASA